MKRHYKSHLGALYLHDVRPATAGWRYLSFKVVAISAGQKLEGNPGNEEIVVVPLVGSAEMTFNNETHELARKDLFRELADIVYLPPRTAYVLTSHAGFEVAVGGAPASRKFSGQSARNERVLSEVFGGRCQKN